MDEMKKPPIGIMPKYIWLEKRRDEIIEAITRYSRELKEIPIGWIEELNDVNLKLLSQDKIITEGLLDYLNTNDLLYNFPDNIHPGQSNAPGDSSTEDKIPTESKVLIVTEKGNISLRTSKPFELGVLISELKEKEGFELIEIMYYSKEHCPKCGSSRVLIQGDTIECIPCEIKNKQDDN